MAINILVAIGIALMVLVTVGLIASYIVASIYNAMSPELQAINNTEVSNSVNAVITGVLKGFETYGNFIPVMVIVMMAVVIIALVLALKTSGFGFSNRPPEL